MTSLDQKQQPEPKLILPGGADKTIIMGATGTGKTVFGAWVLSRQRFDKRPWVCLDYKNEELWDMVGSPPMRRLRLGDMPGKTGLYRLSVVPGQDVQMEQWLWKVWKRENIGLFCDEVTLLPKGDAFRAIILQGRSKRIPIIACTQRPVKVDREFFTESQYKVVFQLDDVRDYKIISGFTRGARYDRILPRHWSYWYDSKRGRRLILQPVSAPAIIARELRAEAPRVWSL